MDPSSPNTQFDEHQKDSFKKFVALKEGVDKLSNTAGGNLNVYRVPKFNEETGSLRRVLDDVHFVKLTNTPVNPGDRPDGSIVGVLMLFNRTNLKLYQPKVLLQNSLLGAMTNLETLGYFGLKVLPEKMVRNDTKFNYTFKLTIRYYRTPIS